MKFIYSLCLFVFFINTFAQDFSGMMSLQLDKKCEMYTSVDKNQSNVVLYFKDNKNNKAILLDSNTSFVDSLSIKNSLHFDKIITDNTFNKVSKIVLANSKLNFFKMEIFDFNSKTISEKTFSIDINTKNILQIFFHNNVLYILSYSKLNKNLILTSVSEEQIISEETIKIETKDNFNFEKLGNYAYSLEKNKFPITLITENQHIPFAQAQVTSKAYLSNNLFIIALESNKNGTSLYSINLNNKTASYNFINRDNAQLSLSCNSIVIDNKIYLVEQNNDNFALTIKDFQGNVVKKLDENDLQKGKFFTEIELGKVEEIDRKKYFKKVDTKLIAINCKKKNGNYYLNIGSVTTAKMPTTDESQMSYMQIGALSGGLIGGLIGALIDSSTNDTDISVNSEMVKNGQTFCQLVLDENFNVVESTKKDFAHTKLKKQVVNSESFTIPSIFYMNDTYYLGYYKYKEKRYFFKKFID